MNISIISKVMINETIKTEMETIIMLLVAEMEPPTELSITNTIAVITDKANAAINEINFGFVEIIR